MPAELPARRLHHLWITGVWVALGCACLPAAPASESFTTGGVFIGAPTGWTPEQTPVDFLDVVGLQTKARWRQLYRAPPPVPSTDRPRAAFTLGGLIGDSFLALQGEDVQQFRNTNQDILAYCRVLGLGEKVTPRLMSMSKLAETGKWGDLRQEAVDGHQELTRILREQRDEDLGVLVDLGVWLRVLEISSALVTAAPEPAVKPLCIGSVDLLKEIRQRFSQTSASIRNHEKLAAIGEALDGLIRSWTLLGDKSPSPEFVVRTAEKLSSLMRKLTLK